MILKPVLRKATEIGIGLTAIATLILVGCGGKSGATAATAAAANSISATITPYKGPFAQGAIVTIKDANGNLVTLTGGTINASGVANVSFPNTVTYPLLVEVTGTYYNEVTGASETTTIPLRSVVASSGVAANVPVTIVTETAVADLQNQIGGGSFSATNPMIAASAVTALNTAGTSFGVPASAVPSFDVTTHKSSDADTLRLAALAVVANKQTGATLADRVKALANAMATLNAASAPADVVSQTDMDSAMTSMTSGASSVMAATVTKPTSPTITTATASLTKTNAAVVASNSVVGSWFNFKIKGVSQGYGTPTTAGFTLFANGDYMYSESVTDPAALKNTPGIEHGTYTWDSSTGAFIAKCPTVDTNGTTGFSHSGTTVGGCTAGSNATPAGLTMTVSGDTLTVLGSDRQTTTSYTRVADATNPLVGSWVKGSDTTMVLTFFANGDYMQSQSVASSFASGGTTIAAQPGLEHGNYTWDSVTSQIFPICPTVDTNGNGAGFFKADPNTLACPVGAAADSFATFTTVVGNTMTLSKTSSVKWGSAASYGIGSGTFTRLTP